ncbi:MAG: VWA domain-containing protein, partial [Gammaproteobacteria bacterium]
MNNFVKKLSTSLIITMMVFASSFQAMADDTEIFFSSVSLNSTTSIQPNVLMVLDTSSSMTNEVGTTGMNRLEHMKEAMHTILDNANNINVGIMRFHGKGGPVLFPVADINADVNTVLGTTPGAPQTFNRIKNGSDDVEEAAGDVISGNSELVLGVSSGILGCGSAGTTTVEKRLNGDNDDVEELVATGTIYDDSSDLELINDDGFAGGDQIVGLLFNNLNIPQGATIHCAELEFTGDEDESIDTDLKVFIQDIGDAPNFDKNNNFDVSLRYDAATDPYVAWDDVPELDENEILTSPDLRSLVQSVTDRTDWSNNNDMVFIINGSGRRTVESRKGGASESALLRVSFTIGGGGGAVNQKVGLRFDDVKIPQGSTITAAYIDFTSTNEASTDASTILIGAEDVDNSAAFTAGATSDVTNRIANDTPSSPLTWMPTAWVPNTLYTTPDLKDLVQDVVDRTGWCGGNAMTFMLSPSAGTRKAVSDDGDQGISPALRIEYDESTATGCNAIAIQAQIKAQNDDAEEETSSGNINFSSSDMELNADGGTSQLVGLRFQDINVSSTDTIVSAELEFTVDEVNSGTTNVTIYGEYTGDAQSFSSTNKISSRTKTTASVNWSPGAWTTEGAKHVSPDISGIVQEIVGHSGWSALNNMSFIIEGTSGERTAESYDGSPISAPRLRINILGSGLGSSAGTITVRQKLHDVVDEIQWKSGTPIVDALYEAGLYYRGDEVLFGRTRGGGYELSPLNESIGSRSEYTRVSHEASYTGNAPTRDGDCDADNLTHDDCTTERIEGTATYDSPIEYECQDNHIVFLSDGQPSRWNLDETTSHYFDKVACDVGTSKGRCGTDIVNFLNNNDQIDNSTLDEDQNITTHTIGFNFAGSTYLQDLASNGGGGFYEATTASQLATVFTEIFADVLASPTSFVAPAVTINTFNRLSHRDELYFALFEPDDSPRWQGNLKRYKLDTSSGNAVIVDENGNPAVDGSTGYFSSSAQSWWTGSVDGQEIAEGGFAGELSSSRKLYTNTGTNSTLSNASNKLQDSNSSLTNAMLNIVTEQAGDPNFRTN